MKRVFVAFLAAIALTLLVSLPAQASVRWVCNVPGEGDVTFVTVADAAVWGIKTADATAGKTFNLRFGEVCRVEGP